MEIQKIFSEIDTNEKLYSVLMSEDELALFSEIQKEFNSATKVLNKKYFKEVASKSGMPFKGSKPGVWNKNKSWWGD